MFTTATNNFPAANCEQPWDHGMLMEDGAHWFQAESLHTQYLDAVPAQPTSTSPCSVEQEALTDEEYFKMSGLDPSKMTKEELRKHKNRASAARSRVRTRERMEQLELMVAQLTAKNMQLQQAITMLQSHQGAPQMVAYPMHYAHTM